LGMGEESSRVWAWKVLGKFDGGCLGMGGESAWKVRGYMGVESAWKFRGYVGVESAWKVRVVLGMCVEGFEGVECLRVWLGEWVTDSGAARLLGSYMGRDTESA
jgi:hypothetical protein